MSLADDIKKRMFSAMKAGLVTDKEILRVAMGEITMAAARAERDLSDDEVQTILKKLVKSNREALASATDTQTRETLEHENVVLADFLPKSLSVAEIQSALGPLLEQLKAAPQLGPAVGMAMKHLKQAGLSVDAPAVNEAVSALRA